MAVPLLSPAVTQGVLSLTKHYVFPRLVDEIASTVPGMSEQDVRRKLQSPHKELSDDTFRYDARGRLLDGALMRICRDEELVDALRALWVALVAADRRLAYIVESVTGENGRLTSKRYSTNWIEAHLSDAGIDPQRKAASNIAHYLEQARVVSPAKRGPEIVGVSSIIDTSRSVPMCMEVLAERYRFTPDDVDAALSRNVHRWLSLTPERFAAAVRR